MAFVLSRRFVLRSLIGLGLALFFAVCQFWFFAAQKLGDRMHDKVFGGAALADFCQTSDITGFPFRLRLSCVGFSAPARLGSTDIVFKGDEAHGAASVTAPNHVILTLSSPLTLLKPDGSPLAKLRHDGLTLDLTWSVGGVQAAELTARSLDWKPETLEAGPAFNIQSLDVRMAPGEADGAGSLHLGLTADGFTAPLLQALLKSPDASHFAFSADLVPAPTPRPDWRLALEEWRTRNGALRIQSAEWISGALSIKFDGALALDETRRPQGQLNVRASGASPLLARLGVPVTPAQARNLLGALLGKPVEAKPQDDVIALPLRLTQGQISLGPIRLPASLQPVY